MDRTNSPLHKRSRTDPLQQESPESQKYRPLLDGNTVDSVTSFWDYIDGLKTSLSNMHFNEGLKPLKLYSSLQELLSVGGAHLLKELSKDYNQLKAIYDSNVININKGYCTSLNFGKQPIIGVIYGPTGSGKSQLLRNLMSCRLLHPFPETIFFIVPHIEMIPPQEMIAWKSQVVEGNFRPGQEGLIIPCTRTLKPNFVCMTYEQLCAEENYDVTNPNNVFANAAGKGPIAIVIDECMEDLGKSKQIAKFFHAFPSKLFDRYPACSGYYVFVVLHNMNPRRDAGGNIATLKIQAKMHILSPKMQPAQLNRFINAYTKGLPLPIVLLLKDIFRYHSMNTQYDWIIYNTDVENPANQWIYLNQMCSPIPMYVNALCVTYNSMLKIHRNLTDKERWIRYYVKKKERLQ
nr:MAG: IVa2 protein [unidentified adenovirus]